MRYLLSKNAVLIHLIFLLTCSFHVHAASDVPKISIDKLNEILGDSAVIVVDVRINDDWNASDTKIKGAQRGDPNAVDTWSSSLPKDKKLILYCA